MIKKEEVYKIGRLGKPHGVKGEVSFQFDDDVFDCVDCDCLVLDIDGILVPFFIDSYRLKSDTIALLTFSGVTTAEAARELTGRDVYFLRRYVPADDDAPLSWSALAGYEVFADSSASSSDSSIYNKVEDGSTAAADDAVPLGTIERVDDSTVNVLIELRRPDGRIVLVPAGGDLITDVDRDRRRISLSIPDGLLDL